MTTWLGTFRPLILVVLVAGLAFAFPDTSEAASLTEIKILTASDAQAGDRFGRSVAVSGDTAVVGASGEDAGGSSAGAAYVFQRNEGGPDNWGQVKKLTASDAGAQDFFSRVAISGDIIVIGATGWTDAASPSAAGAAYLYQRNEGGANNWGEIKRLTASDPEFLDELGFSVAIDSDVAIVGAFRGRPGDSRPGKAYVFQRDEGGANNWGEVRKLTSSDAQDFDVFGASVGVAGGTAVIGAYRADGGGAAYVFERDDGGADNWGEVKKLTASGIRFGISVAFTGDTAIIGARWQQGLAAHFFQRDQGGPGNWGEVSTLTASDAADYENFSPSVAVSNETALVGAYVPQDGTSNTGAAYIFDLSQPKPTATATITPSATVTSTPTNTPIPTATPDPVGGIAFDANLRSLPLETAGPDSSPWGVAVAVVAAASLVAMGGAAWFATRRRA